MRILFFVAILAAGCARRHETDYVLSVGDTLSLEHYSNPSTGYRWNVRTQGVLRLDSSRFVQRPAPFGYCGVGGKEWHHFTGMHQGVDTVTFEYSRGDRKDVEVRSYTVWVR